jgi:hypothetical protein
MAFHEILDNGNCSCTGDAELHMLKEDEPGLYAILHKDGTPVIRADGSEIVFRSFHMANVLADILDGKKPSSR